MVLKMWNFLRGYVRIDLSGFSVERLINQAVALGIIFDHMVRVSGVYTAFVSRTDFARLISIAAKTNTTLTARAHFGLPSIFKRFKKRVLLLVGLAFFVAAPALLTSYIWRIDIEGSARINAQVITEFLADNGFAIGTWRHGIAYRDIEGLLMAEFKEIAWVSLDITGTRATIRLVETIEPPAIIDINTPTDIVAAKDGLIVHMATSRGTPMFRPGDVVRAGDVLVSSRLTIGVPGEEVTYQYVNAASEIWARLYYRINFQIPLVFFEKSFTGRTAKVYSIIVGQNEFTLPHRRHNFIYYIVTTDHNQLGFGQNHPLPLAYKTETHYELVRRLNRRTHQEAQLIGEEIVQGRIAEELTEHAQIITKEISFHEEENYLNIEVFLITLERIDQPKELEAAESP